MPAYSNAAAGGSSSIISTETATGWHVLKIKKYSQTKGVVGVGNSFSSSAVFTIGGHRWCIEYYPDGYTEDGDDCIGFDLSLDYPDAEADVKVKYSFSLLDQAGEPVPEHTATYGVCSFTSAAPSWGFERFIERAELEASPYLKDDSFSVRCVVTVYKESNAEIITTSPRRGLLAFFVLLFIALTACWVLFMGYCSTE